MIRLKSHRSLALVSASLCACLGTGCSHEPAAPTKAQAASAEYDTHIKSIQDDPNMSQEDKDRTIAMIRSRQSGASAPAAPPQ